MLFREWLDSVGVGLLPIAKTTGRILVGLRSHAVAEPGTWGTWGGRAESIALQREVKREFAEETGYTGPMKLIPSFVFQSDYTYHNFIALLPDEFEPRLNWETLSAKWMTLKELTQLPRKHYGLEQLLQNAKGQIRDFVSQSKI